MTSMVEAQKHNPIEGFPPKPMFPLQEVHIWWLETLGVYIWNQMNPGIQF